MFLQGTLGYNNGVFLLNDLCETLYSKKSVGIKARSVRLEDIEKYLTSDGKKARSDYTNSSEVKYNTLKMYLYEEGKLYYPGIYKYAKFKLFKKRCFLDNVNSVFYFEGNNCFFRIF